MRTYTNYDKGAHVLDDEDDASNVHAEEIAERLFSHPTAAIVAFAESLVREQSGEPAPTWDDRHDHALKAARDSLKLSPRTIDPLKTNVRTILERLEHSA